jgi:hypothetical protein
MSITHSPSDALAVRTVLRDVLKHLAIEVPVSVQDRVVLVVANAVVPDDFKHTTVLTIRRVFTVLCDELREEVGDAMSRVGTDVRRYVREALVDVVQSNKHAEANINPLLWHPPVCHTDRTRALYVLGYLTYVILRQGGTHDA